MSTQLTARSHMRCPKYEECCGDNKRYGICRSLACKKIHLTREQFNKTVLKVKNGMQPEPEPWMGHALARYVPCH